MTCVRQFHSLIHAVCNFTVLLRDRFSLGPLYSLDVVEEELVKHHLRWEEELDRRGADSRDGGGGGRSSTKMEGQMSRLSRRWRWAKSHWRK